MYALFLLFIWMERKHGMMIPCDDHSRPSSPRHWSMASMTVRGKKGLGWAELAGLVLVWAGPWWGGGGGVLN